MRLSLSSGKQLLNRLPGPLSSLGSPNQIPGRVRRVGWPLLPLVELPLCAIPGSFSGIQEEASGVLHQLLVGVIGQTLRVLGMAVAVPLIRRHFLPSIQASITPWKKGRAHRYPLNHSMEMGNSFPGPCQQALACHQSQVPCVFWMCQAKVLFLKALANSVNKKLPLRSTASVPGALFWSLGHCAPGISAL